MEILLWLVPAGVVTVLAMLWVSWLGREGRGESVWVGFFLHAILGDFTPLAEGRDAATAARWREQAGLLREALARMWRSDRFLRATTDDGSELAIWDALMPAWAARNVCRRCLRAARVKYVGSLAPASVFSRS